jgi:hypothetical protein
VRPWSHLFEFVAYSTVVMAPEHRMGGTGGFLLHEPISLPVGREAFGAEQLVSSEAPLPKCRNRASRSSSRLGGALLPGALAMVTPGSNDGSGGSSSGGLARR